MKITSKYNNQKMLSAKAAFYSCASVRDFLCVLQFNDIDVDAWVIMSLFDHDVIGSHDFMGKVSIKLDALPINQVRYACACVRSYLHAFARAFVRAFALRVSLCTRGVFQRRVSMRLDPQLLNRMPAVSFR